MRCKNNFIKTPPSFAWRCHPALVSANSYVIEEQAAYDAYGQPFAWCSGDADGDGDVDEDDQDLLAAAYGSFVKENPEDYNWRCDVDLDGYVDGTDQAAFDHYDGTATRADQTSFFTNPYYFTGRRVDNLDNGNLILQFNRHRY